jgi:hypothetical protein
MAAPPDRSKGDNVETPRAQVKAPSAGSVPADEVPPPRPKSPVKQAIPHTPMPKGAFGVHRRDRAHGGGNDGGYDDGGHDGY